MKNARLLFPLASLLMTLLLAGCIQLEVSDSIASDGTLTRSVAVDWSAMAAIAQQFNATNATSTPTDCESTVKNMTEDGFFDVTCDASASKLTVSGKKSLKGDPSFETVGELFYTKYRYKPFADKMMSGFTTELTSGMAQAGTSMSPAQLKQMGLVMNYSVIMPGSVTAAGKGKADGNKVAFDLLEVQVAKSDVVESQELNVLNIAGIGITAIIVIIALLVILFRRKNVPPTPAIVG
jgi:hypothetical protein